MKDTILKYLEFGQYNLPDYERENPILDEFRNHNSELDEQMVKEFTKILGDESKIEEKYFVADLLYLYEDFSEELLLPMLRAGIQFKDPSFNRVFLRPCIRVFGYMKVAEKLRDEFITGDIVAKIGIANLMYWFTRDKKNNSTSIDIEILKRIKSTKNLVELYHYKFLYSKKVSTYYRIFKFLKVPNSADELIKNIKGNEEYENILYNKLGWKQNAC